MIGKRRCPKCAERVRREAVVCRYCGNALEPLASAEQVVGLRRAQMLGGGAALVALIALAVAYASFRQMRTTPTQPAEAAPGPFVTEEPQPQTPNYPTMVLGETLEWSAATEFGPVTRQAGPYVLEITKRTQDDMAAPLIKLTAGTQTVTFEGEMTSPTYSSKITLIMNKQGAVPVIMLQSYTGGAHCCNHVQLAGYSRGRLKVVDLGSWDGDDIPVPTDVSHDGIVDFVMRDNRFLYAFASYAESFAPPQILNVVGGKVENVSKSPAFRSLYEQEMAKAGQSCRPGVGSLANGACPSFVAAAARLGKLDQAWSQMLSAYDATSDWTLPQGCLVSDVTGCPTGQEITYKSYPEALQAFLVRNGYIPRSWIPPERRDQPQPVISEPATIPTT